MQPFLPLIMVVIIVSVTMVGRLWAQRFRIGLLAADNNRNFKKLFAVFIFLQASLQLAEYFETGDLTYALLSLIGFGVSAVYAFDYSDTFVGIGPLTWARSVLIGSILAVVALSALIPSDAALIIWWGALIFLTGLTGLIVANLIRKSLHK